MRARVEVEWGRRLAAALVFLAGGMAGVAEAANPWGPSAQGVFIAEPAPEDVYIHTSNGYRFDPQAGEPRVPAALAAETPRAGERAYFLVQGHAPLSPDFAAMLRAAGAEPLSFLSHNAYVVRATAETAAALGENAAVRWVGAYHPAYRLSEHLRASAGASERVVIKVFSGADVDGVRSKLEALGATIHDVAVTEWNQLVYCSLDGGVEATAAAITGVEWIEPSAEAMELDNTRAQWVIQTFVNGDRRVWDMGITGAGQVVTVHDSGVQMDHCAFVDPVVPVVAAGDYPTHRKVIAYKIPAGLPSTFGDEAPTGGHGTHTSGSTVGDDGASSVNDGQAPAAKLYFTDGANAAGGIYVPGDLNTLFQLSYTGNGGGAARISSNSWGSGSPGDYTTRSQQVDQFMWNHKDYQVFCSNGNDGCSGCVHAPATAKNCVSGGGTRNGISADTIYTSTSRGPTEDGRRKPTLCAPGQSVLSARYVTACSYWNMSGTSMATPTLAGGTALIRQYFTDGWYPTGTAVPGDAMTPTAALMKAVAINSAADDFQPLYQVPDNNVGWGRMLLDNALYFAGDDVALLVWDETAGLSTGAFMDFQWTVKNASVPMKVSMAYTDFQGNPAGFVQLVNNLNLVVTAPNGVTQYLGNVWSGGESITGGSADNLNVEECVRRNTPEVGVWKARISAASAPQGPQPFALVVTGGVLEFRTSVEDGAAAGGSTARLLASAGPNPIMKTDAGTVIRYHLPRAGDVHLGIYDVNGREVRQLVRTHQGTGQQAAAWDARDARGREVPSGIYFYRLEAAGTQLSDKIVVSK